MELVIQHQPDTHHLALNKAALDLKDESHSSED